MNHNFSADFCRIMTEMDPAELQTPAPWYLPVTDGDVQLGILPDHLKRLEGARRHFRDVFHASLRTLYGFAQAQIGRPGRKGTVLYFQKLAAFSTEAKEDSVMANNFFWHALRRWSYRMIPHELLQTEKKLRVDVRENWQVIARSGEDPRELVDFLPTFDDTDSIVTPYLTMDTALAPKLREKPNQESKPPDQPEKQNPDDEEDGSDSDPDELSKGDE